MRRIRLGSASDTQREAEREQRELQEILDPETAREIAEVYGQFTVDYVVPPGAPEPILRVGATIERIHSEKAAIMSARATFPHGRTVLLYSQATGAPLARATVVRSTAVRIEGGDGQMLGYYVRLRVEEVDTVGPCADRPGA